jgi:hypothetical protein
MREDEQTLLDSTKELYTNNEIARLILKNYSRNRIAQCKGFNMHEDANVSEDLVV